MPNRLPFWLVNFPNLSIAGLNRLVKYFGVLNRFRVSKPKLEGEKNML